MLDKCGKSFARLIYLCLIIYYQLAQYNWINPSLDPTTFGRVQRNIKILPNSIGNSI